QRRYTPGFVLRYLLLSDYRKNIGRKSQLSLFTLHHAEQGLFQPPVHRRMWVKAHLDKLPQFRIVGDRRSCLIQLALWLITAAGDIVHRDIKIVRIPD